MEKKKILVVDDHTYVRKVLDVSLRSHGFQVIQASDGEEACSKARESEPDLILMDIKMPELDGYEATRRIRQDDGMKSVPIIMLSAKTRQKDVVEALVAGANDYLAKPFRVNDLLNKIEKHLNPADAAETDGE